MKPGLTKKGGEYRIYYHALFPFLVLTDQEKQEAPPITRKEKRKYGIDFIFVSSFPPGTAVLLGVEREANRREIVNSISPRYVFHFSLQPFLWENVTTK